MRVYVVRKWPLMGRSFVCWNITRESMWLLRKVHFVQSRQRTRLQTRPFVRETGCLCKQKAPMLTRVWQQFEYRIDVTRRIHIENL